MILLSDGQPTVGIISTALIVEMSAAFNSEGIGLTTIGLGTSFNVELMRSLAASEWQTFRMLRFPNALPFIFAGLNVAIVFSVTGALVGEFVGAREGLGMLLLQFNFNMDIGGMFAVLIVLGLLGATLHGLVRTLHRHLIFWAQPDEYITTLTEPELGPARSRWLYPIASVMRTGAVVVGGSDWSVSSLNPLDAIQVAITRRSLDSLPGKAWLPEQQVALDQMLAAYTINGAFANRQERERGSLEVGKSADFVILDRNLFGIPASDIHKVKVVRTYFEGREVYRGED